MPFHNLHDYDEDNIDVWYARIVKVVRVGEFWLDVGRGALVVLGGALLGAFAGGLIGAMVSNFWPGGFWAVMIAGSLLGGLAGCKIAKRVFFRNRTELAVKERTSKQEALFAPHMPGVQERFARARKREFTLFLALLSCGVFLAYLHNAEPRDPVPGFLSREQLCWVVLAVIAAIFVLLVLNGRCPACRRRIGSLLRLRRCSICGVAFRD